MIGGRVQVTTISILFGVRLYDIDKQSIFV